MCLILLCLVSPPGGGSSRHVLAIRHAKFSLHHKKRAQQLNPKTTTSTWSVQQCLHSAMVTSESFFVYERSPRTNQRKCIIILCDVKAGYFNQDCVQYFFKSNNDNNYISFFYLDMYVVCFPFAIVSIYQAWFSVPLLYLSMFSTPRGGQLWSVIVVAMSWNQEPTSQKFVGVIPVITLELSLCKIRIAQFNEK